MQIGAVTQPSGSSRSVLSIRLLGWLQHFTEAISETTFHTSLMAVGNNSIYTNLAQGGGWKFQLIGDFFSLPFSFVPIFKIPTRQEYKCEALPGCGHANTLHYNLQEKERKKGGAFGGISKKAICKQM